MKRCVTEEEISISKLIMGIIMISAFKWILDLIDKGVDKARSIQLGVCMFFIPWFVFSGWEDASFKIPPQYLQNFWYMLDILMLAFCISVLPLIVNATKNKKTSNDKES